MKDNMTPFSLWIPCAESLAGSQEQIEHIIELLSRTQVKFKLHTYQHGPLCSVEDTGVLCLAFAPCWMQTLEQQWTLQSTSQSK